MILHSYQLKNSASTKSESFIDEFDEAYKDYAKQAFSAPELAINPLFNIKEFELYGFKGLSQSQAWEGEKLKAHRPQLFVPVIQAAGLIPNTYRKTEYGETFDRVSIQPNWQTGKLSIVKEEVHVIEAQRRILFLGRPVNRSEAKQVLGDFDDAYFENQGSLFHVEHGLAGEEDRPINTWRLVILDRAVSSQAIDKINQTVQNADFKYMYSKVMEALTLAKGYHPELKHS